MALADVQALHEVLIAQEEEPKTFTRRLSSLSNFYRYRPATAMELRLPMTVPNPARAQFTTGEFLDLREETRALSVTRAKQLMGRPAMQYLALRTGPSFAARRTFSGRCTR